MFTHFVSVLLLMLTLQACNRNRGITVDKHATVTAVETVNGSTIITISHPWNVPERCVVLSNHLADRHRFALIQRLSTAVHHNDRRWVVSIYSLDCKPEELQLTLKDIDSAGFRIFSGGLLRSIPSS